MSAETHYAAQTQTRARVWDCSSTSVNNAVTHHWSPKHSMGCKLVQIDCRSSSSSQVQAQLAEDSCAKVACKRWLTYQQQCGVLPSQPPTQLLLQCYHPGSASTRLFHPRTAWTWLLPAPTYQPTMGTCHLIELGFLHLFKSTQNWMANNDDKSKVRLVQVCKWMGMPYTASVCVNMPAATLSESSCKIFNCYHYYCYYYITWYYMILYCMILYDIVLYDIIWYDIVLCCIVLYYLYIT